MSLIWSPSHMAVFAKVIDLNGFSAAARALGVPKAAVSRAILSAKFPKIDVQVVTSEDPDEIRKDRVQAMQGSKHRVLVATDCLSEGINLQHLFTGVLHYDLPWNPNRLEQREGRVDRFGQPADTVMV